MKTSRLDRLKKFGAQIAENIWEIKLDAKKDVNGKPYVVWPDGEIEFIDEEAIKNHRFELRKRT